MADNDLFELAEPDRPSVKRSIPIFEEEVDASTASSPNHDFPNVQTRQVPLRDDIQPWTRFRESRSDFVRMTVAGLSTIILAWLFSGWSTIHLAGGICIVGTAVVAIMAYPLIVGLERPIRMSPERAVHDYFESLEHHGPLYRRMWIFLTPEAQNCRSFSDYDSFKLYWKQRVKEWRHRGNAWPQTPVVISVDQFQSKPDASDPNKSLLKFSIAVSLRGHRSLGPIASYKLSWTAFRGPDRQWYLADGNLPEVHSSTELEG